MRENRTSGSMRGCRKRATSRRACALLYGLPLVEGEVCWGMGACPHGRRSLSIRLKWDWSRRGFPRIHNRALSYYRSHYRILNYRGNSISAFKLLIS